MHQKESNTSTRIIQQQCERKEEKQIENMCLHRIAFENKLDGRAATISHTNYKKSIYNNREGVFREQYLI